jgi:hypothetical protein
MVTLNRSLNLWLLISAVALVWSGCSGDQEEAEDVVEGAEGEGEEAAAEGEEAAAEGEEAAEEAVNEAAPTAEAEAEAAKPATPAPAPVDAPGFTGKSAVRYVTSFALNVRSAPSKDAPVLKHVKWGDKVNVVINGEWAKLAPGEYISSKHLSATAPGAKAKKKGK